MTVERIAYLCCCSTQTISKLCQAGSAGNKTGFIGAYKENRRWVIPPHYYTFLESLERKTEFQLMLRFYNLKRV